MKNMKNFKPTKEMVKAAEVVFISYAFTKTIRPTVVAYHRKALDHFGFTDVKLNETFLMSDEDFKKYHNLSKVYRNKAKLHVENDDFCPLLVAEHLESDAETSLINTMEPITGLKAKDVYIPKHRDKLIDLLLTLLSKFVEPLTLIV